LVDGEQETDLIARQAQLPCERTREILAQQIESGLLLREDGRLSLAFPVIRESDSRVLRPVLDGIVEHVMRAVMTQASDAVGTQLHRLGYPQQEHYQTWDYWMKADTFTEAVRLLWQRGILPDPGDPAPTSFAVLGWLDDVSVMET
jgi:hypothetical protein